MSGARSQRRAELAREVVANAAAELALHPLDAVLAEALRVEDARAATMPASDARRARDRRVRETLCAGLVPGGSREHHERAVAAVLAAYVDEIGGSFDPRVHRALSGSGRRLFNWMSHAEAGWRPPFGLVDLLPTRVSIEGAHAALVARAQRGPVLLLPTHQSHNDIPLFYYVLDELGLPAFAWAAGLNLFSGRLLSSLMLRAGAFRVDRTRPCALYHAALEHYAARLLEAGRSLLVFAGGGRSRSGAIEAELRLGLIAAALRASTTLCGRDPSHPGVAIVPVTVSWPYVLEAPWLIDEHLLACGIGRPSRASGPTLAQELAIARRFFGRGAGVAVRFGEPIEAGSEVEDPLRRRARVDALGLDLVARLHGLATVRPSQAAARALFEAIRARHPKRTLAALLELPPDASCVSCPVLLAHGERLDAQLREASARGALALAPALRASAPATWLDAGLARLAEWHGRALAERRADEVVTRDLALLYYYRNRLSGYGLADPGASFLD